MWAYATMGRERVLEGLAEAVEGTLNTQGVANTLWAYATMGREPGAGATRDLEGRTETVAGTLNTQNVANTLWAYAMIGREPGAGLMRELGEDGCGCGHVELAGRGQHAVGVCDDGARDQGGLDEGAGGAGGGGGGHVERAGCVKHAVSA